MAKRKSISLATWAPLLVVALLLGFAFLLPVGEQKLDDVSMQESRIDPDSLSEGRHFGPVRLDSVLWLLSRIDPAQTKIAVDLQADSLRLSRKPTWSAPRFRRVFLNQRSAKDFRRLKNCPVRMLPGEDAGFVAPVVDLEQVKYLILPYDMLAGMLAEYGDLGVAEMTEKTGK